MTPRPTGQPNSATSNAKQATSATRGQEQDKVKIGSGKQKGGKADRQGEAARYFSPSPEFGDQTVKMQKQMAICKIKGQGVKMEVAETWPREMRELITLDQTGKITSPSRRIEEDCAEKAFLLYIQPWLARGSLGKWHMPKNGNRKK